MDISMDKSGKPEYPAPAPALVRGYISKLHVLTHSEYERWSAKLRKGK